MTKQAEISRRILERMADGFTLEESLDDVLGKGTFAKLASDVYDGLVGRSGRCYCSSLAKSVYADKDSPSPKCDFCAGLR